ncbi:MAG TPA: LysR family transcriptional regulator [Polyangiaceae bacterium]|nr:LysR family transcriptional regulator [Polyangiaceae bacterium]
MDWSTLSEFLVVAERGSISSAARELTLSQPTLSRRLQRLEESLDVTLFARGRRGLLLTAAGERVRDLAVQMRSTAQQIRDAAEQGHDRMSGVVRISAPEAQLGTLWLPRALLPLRHAHPDLVLELVIENQLTDLERRAADIAIRMSEPKGESLTARRVGKIDWGLYAANSYLQGKKRINALADLRAHDILLYQMGTDVRQMAWADKRGLADRIALRATSFDAVIGATRAGWGVGLLPMIVGEADPTLTHVLAASERPSIPFWLVTHAELRRSRRIRTVFSHLVSCFERDRALFQGRN